MALLRASDGANVLMTLGTSRWISYSTVIEAGQRIDQVDVVFTLALQLALRHSPILIEPNHFLVEI
jgi:hypothetical protein